MGRARRERASLSGSAEAAASLRRHSGRDPRDPLRHGWNRRSWAAQAQRRAGHRRSGMRVHEVRRAGASTPMQRRRSESAPTRFGSGSWLLPARFSRGAFGRLARAWRSPELMMRRRCSRSSVRPRDSSPGQALSWSKGDARRGLTVVSAGLQWGASGRVVAASPPLRSPQGLTRRGFQARATRRRRSRSCEFALARPGSEPDRSENGARVGRG